MHAQRSDAKAGGHDGIVRASCSGLSCFGRLFNAYLSIDDKMLTLEAPRCARKMVWRQPVSSSIALDRDCHADGLRPLDIFVDF